MNKKTSKNIKEENRQKEKGREDANKEMRELFRKAIESLKRMDTDPEFRESISKRIS